MTPSNASPAPHKNVLVSVEKNGRTVHLGAIREVKGEVELTDWRYEVDPVTGDTTGQLHKVGQRMVTNVVADLQKLVRRMAIEGSGVGWDVRGTDLVPEHRQVVVSVAKGANEGHLIRVDLYCPVAGQDRCEVRSLFVVKTTSGRVTAQRIATKISQALGLL